MDEQALTPESEETLATFLTVLAAWTMTVERRETEVDTCFFMRADIFDRDLTDPNDRSYHPIRTYLYITRVDDGNVARLHHNNTLLH